MLLARLIVIARRSLRVTGTDRLIRRLRVAGRALGRLRPRPRSYRDVVSDYAQYESLQKGKYCSFESAMPNWEEGQRRYLDAMLVALDRKLRILDIACGDGVGLRHFKTLGFSEVVGVEFSREKAEIARRTGYRVEESDMHDLGIFSDGDFDVIYSSHTLEHAYQPRRVVRELRRLLRAGGRLFVVLPYPDPPNPANDEAHGGKYELGTDRTDGGKTVTRFFVEQGFAIKDVRFDQFREPEIWLSLERS